MRETDMSKRNGIGRGQHPNSRANLKPVVPGQVLNPTGKSGGPFRLYTDSIRALASEPLPEMLRLALNHRMREQLATQLRGLQVNGKRIEAKHIPDFYEPGITWAQANSLRLHIASIMNGEIGASIELRESTEGRATMRVEFESRRDKLEELLKAFQRVADMDDDDEDVQPKLVQ
jgi:hypothetical protein